MGNKKILVTGGLGFIGSHTTVELIRAGYEVIIVDNLSNANEKVLDNIEKITAARPEFHKFDLCDETKVFDLFNQHADLEAVIHFAASKAVGESVENPLLYYHNNLYSLINIMRALKGKQSKLVFSSSCTVYGQPEVLPVTEESPFQKAESPYGNTKQICEAILLDACKANAENHVISLRYFNPVGADESALIGELPIGVPGNLVPFITQTAAGIRKELLVFGSDYNTPDGSAIRDFIHVTDLAKAHVLALDRMLTNKQKTNYEYYNLGSGKGNSVLEAIASFERVSGLKLNYRIVGRRSGDVEKIYADTQLAARELGWNTVFTLDDMMRSAWKWQQYLETHPELLQS